MRTGIVRDAFSSVSATQTASTSVNTLLSPVWAFLGQDFFELPECDLLAGYLGAVRELLVTEGEDDRGEVAGAAPGSGAAKRRTAWLRRFHLAPAYTEPAQQDNNYFKLQSSLLNTPAIRYSRIQFRQIIVQDTSLYKDKRVREDKGEVRGVGKGDRQRKWWICLLMFCSFNCL